MERKLGGKVTPDNITEKMLENEESWNIIEECIKAIITSKEKEERELQSEHDISYMSETEEERILNL